VHGVRSDAQRDRDRGGRVRGSDATKVAFMITTGALLIAIGAFPMSHDGVQMPVALRIVTLASGAWTFAVAGWMAADPRDRE